MIRELSCPRAVLHVTGGALLFPKAHCTRDLWSLRRSASGFFENTPGRPETGADYAVAPCISTLFQVVKGGRPTQLSYLVHQVLLAPLPSGLA